MRKIIFSLLLLFSCYRPGQIVFTCSMDQFEQVRKHTEFCTNVIRMEEPFDQAYYFCFLETINRICN